LLLSAKSDARPDLASAVNAAHLTAAHRTASEGCVVVLSLTRSLLLG
jgi:hypothetical protein